MRWPGFVALLCVLMLAAGCGSSSNSNTATSGATAPTATATATTTTTTTTTGTGTSPTVESADLRRLPRVPASTGQAPNFGSDTRAFLRHAFNDAQAMWQREFHAAGVRYRPARLTIFSQSVETACGSQTANIGPFYCPASFGVYLDPVFFTALSRRVGVRLGAFAQAYVVAHEVGHHIQTLLGITAQKAAADRQHPAGKNIRSVLFELQADCFAGVWARSAYQQGEVSEANIRDALNAAAIVGDDFQSKLSGRQRLPEDWTHGSSAQRQRWFKTGFNQGDPAACDTFSQ